MLILVMFNVAWICSLLFIHNILTICNGPCNRFSAKETVFGYCFTDLSIKSDTATLAYVLPSEALVLVSSYQYEITCL
jgi:hypothetical protein